MRLSLRAIRAVLDEHAKTASAADALIGDRAIGNRSTSKANDLAAVVEEVGVPAARP